MRIVSRATHVLVSRIRSSLILLSLVTFVHLLVLVNIITDSNGGWKGTLRVLMRRNTEVNEVRCGSLSVGMERDGSANGTGGGEDPIHVVLTSTSSYTVGLLALINSTLSSSTSSSLARLRFHVVGADKKDAERIIDLMRETFGSTLDDVDRGNELERKLMGYGLEEMGDKRLEGVKVWAGYRATTLSQPIVFARYLIPAVLPLEVSRVIYLDQDVVVQGDLAELWAIDLGGRPIAAARLCRPTALWRKQFVMSKQPLVDGGFDHDTCTLNNGVLVYDLEMWRSSFPSYSDELFEWTLLNSEDKLYSLGSQPPFNLVSVILSVASAAPPDHECNSRNYKVLDDRWNMMDLAGLRDEAGSDLRPPLTRSREEVAGASILHWNGVMKPWLCDGEGDYSEIWTNYFPNFRASLPSVPDPIDTEICSTMVLTELPDPPSMEQFTVVIVSFARIDTLIKIVKHLQHSNYVREIIVVWNNLDIPCPNDVLELPWVRCIQQTANLVHNRFLVWPNVTTEAVLHHDDDLLAPLADLEAAFQIWRRHRDQILGFEPRVIVCDGDDESSQSGFVFSPTDGLAVVPTESTDSHQNCHYRFKLSEGHFHLVIGKLFFVGRPYMKSYFSHPALIDLSTSAPCEDLALNFLLSSPPPPLLPLPPLVFKSNLTELHSKRFLGLSQGISSTIWREKRHECVAKLVEIFGKRPEKQGSYYVRDGVRRRVYKMRVREGLSGGWCSDVDGSRVCRQP